MKNNFNSKINSKSQKDQKVVRGHLLVAGILSGILIILLNVQVTTVQSQSGGNFEITQSVIAGGGGQQSTGGNFSVAGSIGQALANGEMRGSQFSITSGFWNYSPTDSGQGFESDVAARPIGDGGIQSNDIVQVQRFQIGLDQPFQSNEIQRADSAPLNTFGDGQIQSNDVVQAQRFQIGLDQLQFAAGPTTLSGGRKSNPIAGSLADKIQKLAAPRELRVESTNIGQGQTQVLVNIRVDAFGDEAAYGFGLSYNPAAFMSASVAIGTAGGGRLCNTTVVGQVNCSINNFPDDLPGSSTDQIGEIHPGNNQLLVRITLNLTANPPTGATPLMFTNVNASNDAAQALVITSQNGAVTILGPTAAQVSVGGRVLTANGQGITNALVTLNASNGSVRTARTNSFGYFKFTEVSAGETYIFNVSSKEYSFAPQVVYVTENISDLNFTSQ